MIQGIGKVWIKMKAIELRTEQLENPLGIDVAKPRITWICHDGIRQSAYEVEISTKDRLGNKKILWNSGYVLSDKTQVVLEDLKLSSRQRLYWRVRLWDESGEEGEWSQEAYFEMGLLEKADWNATWINPEVDKKEGHQPASYLRNAFDLSEVGEARLYITAHGLYEAFLNGKRIGDFVLAPGVSSYQQRLHYQTYDVTDLLQVGRNSIEITLGDGWYRSCSGVSGERNFYGDEIALLFQLESDGITVCKSDLTWEASQEGPILENDMQQGEIYDARKERITSWHPVNVVDFGYENLTCSNSVPITEMERFEGNLIITPNGEMVIDYGQNLAGYIEFSLNAHEGDTIIIHHGETLDENGNFTMENFQDRERHVEGGIRQRVEYFCKEGVNHYKSKFTIWGFRYGKIETQVDLAEAKFTSIAVYSKMDRISEFECSNEDVNQLVKNCLWSMKSNFCDVPTDCPTRERAAWTGDAGVFAETGLYLAENYSLFRKWLGECRLNQTEDGKVVNIAPPNQKPSMFTAILSGSVGWGDACIIVPYTLYKRYQDLQILEENYAMMKSWYGFLIKRASNKKEEELLFKENPYSEYTIETGVDYGEWCEPGVNPQLAMRSPQYKVATAYLAYSGRLLSEIAQLLNRVDEAHYYKEVSEKATLAYRYVATENGRIRSERQAEYVQAIQFGLLEEKDTIQAASDLNDLVVRCGYHLNTGFLSTPYLCEVLTRYGYVETAYRLLLQDTMPSWLYSVKKGATTIWETWDGIDESGKVKASLNHYSYGAIVGWLFKDISGIRVENGKIIIEPKPSPQIEHVRGTYHSPIGTIVSEWKFTDKGIHFIISIPSNQGAEIRLPNGKIIQAISGVYELWN